jgi:CRP-like cAMP-binding protein
MLGRKKRVVTDGPGAAPGAAVPVDPSMPTYVEMTFAQVPMFSACTMDELLHIASRAAIRPVDTDANVIVEGARGDEFFVILDGTVRVTRSGAPVAELGPGDFFGEMALFDDVPRNATVTATGPLRVLVLDRAGFQDALTQTPIRDHVLQGMARRIDELGRRPV